MIARCSLETEPWWALAMMRPGAAALARLGHDLRRGGTRWSRRGLRVRHEIRVLVGSPLRTLGRDLVEAGGQPLGQAAGVGEDDGRAVLLDEVDDVLLDVGPDAGGPSGIARLLVVLARHRHVLDRHHDPQVPLLGAGRGDDLDGLRAAEEARDLVQRTHGRAEADPLRGLVEERVEPLEADAEVGAALGAGDGVHLVDDHGVDAAQGLARLAGQHEEERLGRGDQDVGRGGAELAAVGGAGVARAQADGHLGHRRLEALGRVADAGQRSAEVALDVDAERLERGDVEHPRAPGLVVGPLGAEQPVDGVQEGTQGLAAAGRRHHERVVAVRDGLPRTVLRRGWTGERRLEPRPGGRAEAVEGGHALQSVTGVRHSPRLKGRRLLTSAD